MGINLLGRKKKKSLTITPIVTSTIPETNLLDNNSKSSENLVSPNDISSTILRRLLTTPESEAAKRAEKLALKKAKKSAEGQSEQVKKSSSSNSPGAKNKAKISPPLPAAEDSSSECNSAFEETASIASSTASRKRKHRNPTGFPSPKKKKPKKKALDLPVKKQSSSPQSKKQSPPQSSP